MLRPSLSLAGRCAFRPGLNMKSYMQSEPQRENPVSKNHPKNWSRWPLEATPFWWFFSEKKDEFKFAALQITEDGRFSKLPSFDFSHFVAAFASRRAIGKWGYSFVNLNYEVPIAESKAQSPWWSCLGCTKLLAFGCSVQDQRHSSHELYQVLKSHGEWDQNYREK